MKESLIEHRIFCFNGHEINNRLKRKIIIEIYLLDPKAQEPSNYKY